MMDPHPAPPHIQTIVGLEVHVQLLTASKLFSGCINRFNPDGPNTQTDVVTLALPGALPVMNRRAFDLALKAALALHCDIAPVTKWDRKQYFYPDLPKGYQISQYDMPFSRNGWLEIPTAADSAQPTRIRINRVHLEDDAGKNVHDESGRGGESQVDLNRAGTPLLEIVSEPDLRSAFQARRYLEDLRLLMLYLEVSDCNMQEGSLRCDANVNLRFETPAGAAIATPIVEIKNMNSFRNVEAAIEYEAQRQWRQWQADGLTIRDAGKQTRGWNADQGVTFTQRGKEEAADYRYFPDPDLVPVYVNEPWLEQIRRELPEFPAARRRRFEETWGLSPQDAATIIEQGRAYADYFDTVAATCGDAKQAANWILQDVQRDLHERGIGIDEHPLQAPVLGALLARVVTKSLSVKAARDVYARLVSETRPAVDRVAAIIQELGLDVVADDAAILAAIDAVVAANERAAADVRAGKVQAAGPLIGQVMKQCKGASPATVRELLLQRLAPAPP